MPTWRKIGKERNDETDAARILARACAESLRGIPGKRSRGNFGHAQRCAEGGKAGIAKPMKGLGAGVFEIALPYCGNAFRVVYAVQVGDDLWVVHAFQNKSTHGIKTPKQEIDLILERLKRLKEILR
jgi:phage-related protein